MTLLKSRTTSAIIFFSETAYLYFLSFNRFEKENLKIIKIFYLKLGRV